RAWDPTYRCDSDHPTARTESPISFREARWFRWQRPTETAVEVLEPTTGHPSQPSRFAKTSDATHRLESNHSPQDKTAIGLSAPGAHFDAEEIHLMDWPCSRPFREIAD